MHIHSELGISAVQKRQLSALVERDFVAQPCCQHVLNATEIQMLRTLRMSILTSNPHLIRHILRNFSDSEQATRILESLHSDLEPFNLEVSHKIPSDEQDSDITEYQLQVKCKRNQLSVNISSSTSSFIDDPIMQNTFDEQNFPGDFKTYFYLLSLQIRDQLLQMFFTKKTIKLNLPQEVQNFEPISPKLPSYNIRVEQEMQPLTLYNSSQPYALKLLQSQIVSKLSPNRSVEKDATLLNHCASKVASQASQT